MSAPTSINPNSLKIRFAYRFLHSLNNLNNPPKTSPPHIKRRSRRVKIAAYASMASLVGSRRAWSRAILSKIRRNPGVFAKNKKRRVHKITCPRPHHAVSVRRRNPSFPNPTREVSNGQVPFGYSGQEGRLRKLVPGAAAMDACGLLDETADYIKCLATQVEVMRTLVDLYSTI